MTDYLGGWLTHGKIGDPGSAGRALDRIRKMEEAKKLKKQETKNGKYCSNCGVKL